MSSSSSSSMLAAALLATLVVGAWCGIPPVSFTVQNGSDAKRLALLIKYDVEGDAMAEVELKEPGSNDWLPLTKCTGDVWEVKSAYKPLKGPFSIRFVSVKGMRNVFDDVLPADFEVGAKYAPQE
uniref:Uncharacterized protein n=1 Tax=Avena sativa TaxID=4498 RepID=A0ACD5UX89_AVESA